MRLAMSVVCMVAMALTVSAGDAAVDQFLNSTGVALTSYRALRTLEASTRGGSMRARLIALTSDDPDRGFEYSIVEETGSGVIRNKVLRAALDTEAKMSAAERARGALTHQNYRFGSTEPTTDGEVRVPLHPLREDKMLVDGYIVLNDAGDLLRVEGRLIKRPSFWTRRVDVLRRYGRIGGVRVPLTMHSTAHVLIVGTSTFDMTYDYQSINGVAVSAIAEQ